MKSPHGIKSCHGSDCCRRGFTIIELLITVSIIGVLVLMCLRILPSALESAKMATSLDNLRQIGVAFRLYAADHDYTLPQRVTTTNKWPSLLYSYLNNTDKVYADPADTNNFLISGENPLSDQVNYTSYIMNGYNDLGAYTNSSVTVKLSAIADQSAVILVGLQFETANFYMDFVEGNQINVLNRTAYHGGATYLFTDGSVRFILNRDYSDQLWLIDKSYQIPSQ
jgi:prepilin-type N-terminal cleavage/methylation domain-containing protein/prepilin-type processing-associated H-X9-DG protein